MPPIHITNTATTSINRVNAIWRIVFFFGLIERAMTDVFGSQIRCYSAAEVVLLTGVGILSFFKYTAGTGELAAVTAAVLTIIGFT